MGSMRSTHDGQKSLVSSFESWMDKKTVRGLSSQTATHVLSIATWRPTLSSLGWSSTSVAYLDGITGFSFLAESVAFGPSLVVTPA